MTLFEGNVEVSTDGYGEPIGIFTPDGSLNARELNITVDGVLYENVPRGQYGYVIQSLSLTITTDGIDGGLLAPEGTYSLKIENCSSHDYDDMILYSSSFGSSCLSPLSDTVDGSEIVAWLNEHNYTEGAYTYPQDIAIYRDGRAMDASPYQSGMWNWMYDDFYLNIYDNGTIECGYDG